MAIYKFYCDQIQHWRFEIEADNEEEAHEHLWDIVGFDGGDIESIEPWAYDFNIQHEVILKDNVQATLF